MTKQKIRRQAMEVSPKELLDLGHKLLDEMIETNFKLFGKKDVDKAMKKKCQVAIINKTRASDKWRFE
jgi:hypothetical protein